MKTLNIFLVFFCGFVNVLGVTAESDAFYDNEIDFVFQNHSTLIHELNTLFKHSCADIATIYSIGKSVLNKPLLTIEFDLDKAKNLKNKTAKQTWKFVDNEISADLRPRVKYVGNMHGNEVVGRQILVYFTKYICLNYKRDERVKNLLSGMVIHILPTMNPDGYEKSTENCRGYLGRNNDRNEDLNRNFPDHFEPDYDPDIQPETKAIMRWVTHQHFVLSINFHGGAQVACYPYDNNDHKCTDYKTCGDSLSPDNDFFEMLAHTYSNNHRTMHLGEACPNDPQGFEGGISNGNGWYPLSGGMEDFNYFHGGCMEITVELTCCKHPPEETLVEHWKDNRKSLFKYLEKVHEGVKGYVYEKDGVTPLPNALVIIENREVFVVKTSKFGKYWRLLTPGSYNIHVYLQNKHPKFKAFEKIEGDSNTKGRKLIAVQHIIIKAEDVISMNEKQSAIILNIKVGDNNPIPTTVNKEENNEGSNGHDNGVDGDHESNNNDDKNSEKHKGEEKSVDGGHESNNNDDKDNDKHEGEETHVENHGVEDNDDQTKQQVNTTDKNLTSNNGNVTVKSNIEGNTNTSNSDNNSDIASWFSDPKINLVIFLVVVGSIGGGIFIVLKRRRKALARQQAARYFLENDSDSEENDGDLLLGGEYDDFSD